MKTSTQLLIMISFAFPFGHIADAIVRYCNPNPTGFDIALNILTGICLGGMGYFISNIYFKIMKGQ